MTDRLPDGVEHVRTTEVFDHLHHPAGLRRTHRVADGVWARLVVHSGSLTFVFEAYPTAGEPSYRTWFAALNNTRVTTSIKPDRKRVKRGKRVKVHVSATNRGPATAEDARICARIPKGFAVVNSAGAIVNGQRICWTEPTIAPGARKKKTFVLRVLRSAKGKPRFNSSVDPSNANRATDSSGVEVVSGAPPKPLPPTG